MRITRFTVRTALIALVALGVAAGALNGGAPAAEARSCGFCPETTTTALNLRAGPSKDAPVILVMPAGAEVGVDRSSGSTNGYLPVQYQWIEGWAHEDYLASEAPNAVTVAEALNLRAGPGTEHQILAVMPAGATVYLTGAGTVDGWVTLAYQGLEGYANSAYLIY